MTSNLRRIHDTVQYLTELDGQDRSLVIEMSQEMISDLNQFGELRPLAEYVRRYCDVIDSPEQADEIAASI